MSSDLLLLRIHRVPRLVDVSATKPLGVAQWLGEQRYKPSAPIVSGTVTLGYTDNISYAAAIAGDLFRMAHASFETMASITEHPKFEKSLGWPLIQGYYGAYFSAHSLMRAYCSGVVRLEQGQVDQLRAAIAQGGLADDGSLKIGYYFMEGGLTPGQLSLRFIGSNPHQNAWQGFIDFLKILGTRVQNGAGLTSEKAVIVSMLDDLKTCITTALPSEIRNRINYRQEYGVWFPFSSRTDAYDDVLSILKRWGDDPTILAPQCRQRHEVKRLAALSVCCVSLLRETMLDIDAAVPSGRAFSKKRTSLFLKDLLG